MSDKRGEQTLDAIARPGPTGVDIDANAETRKFLLGLLVAGGDPPEPLSITDGDDWIQALPWNLKGTYTWAEFISHDRHGQPLAIADLPDRLDRYRLDLARHGLQPLAIDTYVAQARMFIKWTRRVEGTQGATIDELFQRYADDVRRRDLAPLTVQSYVQYASMFCRWLNGRYAPGRRDLGEQFEGDEDDSWLSEQQTQARLVSWLKHEGWEITGEAVGHQHGVDVTAVRDGVTMDIEVKGHPQNVLIAGSNKGQARTFHPAAQARTYFANAIHAALTTLHKYPDHAVAIALPAVERYRSMVAATRDPLERLGIGVYLVPKSGDVEALVNAQISDVARA